MPTTCQIIFENPQRVFYAGQLVRGTVNLTLTKEKRVRGVYVQIFGRAYAYWTEYCNVDHNRYRNRNNNTRSSGHHVSYTGSEDYLDEKTYVVGSSSGEMQLLPGTHTYNFEVVLPAGLPTSVQNSVGHIAYGVNVVLHIPLWIDKEFKENFTVIKPLNLNVDPSFRSPASGREEREFYPLGFLCCWPSGPLKIEGETPVRGYTPGQTINVTVNIINDSNEEVGTTNVELIKQITFYGHANHNGRYESKQKVVDEVITGKEERGCPIGQKETIHLNILIPPIPPTDFSTSNVVHVKYFLRVTGVMVGCFTRNSVLNLPITIGSYPLSDDGVAFGMNAQSETIVVSTQPTAPQLPNGNSTCLPYPSGPNMPTAPIIPAALAAPSAPSAPSAPFEPFPTENPPTYEEAMASTGESNDEFKPKYPMFRRGTSYSIDTSQVNAALKQ